MEAKVDAPVERGGLPHEIHLEVMRHLHRRAHTAPQLNGDLIAIICAAELRCVLVISWFTFRRGPHLVIEETEPFAPKGENSAGETLMLTDSAHGVCVPCSQLRQPQLPFKPWGIVLDARMEPPRPEPGFHM